MLHTDFSKKIVAGALAPVLVLGMAPAAAFADDAAVSALQAGTSASLVSAATVDAEANAVATFSDEGIALSDGATGVKATGTELTINKPGTYIVTGSCAEGNIKVKKGTTGVTLVLRDLELSCSTTAPLAVNKDNGDTVLVVEGAVTLVDQEDPANEDSADEAVADAFEGAAIKVKAGSNLAITGTGTLTADGSACKNAIKGGATASISIEDGVTVSAIAANTGIASDGSLAINGGDITVRAGNDGIKVAPDEGDESSEGVLVITGGTIYVTAADDGIKADPDAASAAAATGGSATITGGSITVNAGDDGIKAYNDLNIGTKDSATGPDITVVRSYEGFEAATVNLYSGTGNIMASDDGVNAANKDILDGESAELFNLNIYGGTWTVDAAGDGLDSNGNLTVAGGTTVVYGPTTGGNGVFDYAERGGSFSVTGGNLLGFSRGDMEVVPTSGVYVLFGASGMGGGMGGGPGGFRMMATQGESEAVVPDGVSLSAQARGGAGQASGGSSVSVSAGQTVTVKDSSGNAVVSATAAKNAQWVLYAGEGLQAGESYTLSANGVQLATTTAAGSSTGGTTGGSAGDGGSGGGGADGGTTDGSGGGTTGGSGGSTGGSNGAGGTTSGGAGGESPDPGQQGQQPGQSGSDKGEVRQPATDDASQGSSDQASNSQMFRLYNPNSGEHFYTASATERDALIGFGWRGEGVAWIAPESGDAVYRLYNPNAGDHHYTTSEDERDYLVSVGWLFEGVGWYSDTSQGQGLYRLYNPNAIAGAHHYTTSAAERDYLVALGWRSEGIGWYGVA